MLVSRTCLKALRADPAPGPFYFRKIDSSNAGTSQDEAIFSGHLNRIGFHFSPQCTGELAHTLPALGMIQPYSEFRESTNSGFLKCTIVDTDPDGSSLDHKINHLQTEVFNIAESYRSDIREVGGQQGSW
ncbi:hypothetical protein [Mesorhizobium sp.]|uniref:hypothetical protein n=1 Tax=Mesorhizobium sp. TaxID=1871066 RepID=UPI000FEA25E2|nr:hypothetical protein [Mesorhizobium sp.]RWI31653.1 MAG: hypothetical protein EOR14_35700 [Mesorhizobium sp.]RWJ92601.1 MAG: hypothetical protein EOR38_32450 [Mesorhizobium sp.]